MPDFKDPDQRSQWIKNNANYFAVSYRTKDLRIRVEHTYAESEPMRPPIPTESGHPIRSKAATDSERSRPPC
jgi:hypothetical protein